MLRRYLEKTLKRQIVYIAIKKGMGKRGVLLDRIQWKIISIISNVVLLFDPITTLRDAKNTLPVLVKLSTRTLGDSDRLYWNAGEIKWGVLVCSSKIVYFQSRLTLHLYQPIYIYLIEY